MWTTVLWLAFWVAFSIWAYQQTYLWLSGFAAAIALLAVLRFLKLWSLP